MPEALQEIQARRALQVRLVELVRQAPQARQEQQAQPGEMVRQVPPELLVEPA